jgi:hypothetical protein
VCDTIEGTHWVTVFVWARAKDPSQLRETEPEKFKNPRWVEPPLSNLAEPLFAPLATYMQHTADYDVHGFKDHIDLEDT